MPLKKIMIIGDVFFSNKKDMLIFFNKIKKKFNNYLVIANLEGSIKYNHNNLETKAVHMSLPKFNKNEIPDNLVFSLVNNHVTDFGINNFKLNIKFFGNKVAISSQEKISNCIGSQKFIFLADKKEQCLIKETKFLSFTNKEVSKISNEIKSAIVVVHGGIEYRYYPTPYQRALARRIVAYGAKSVIFHHSHVIGQHEYWNGHLIHYGLGNAFFADSRGIHTLEKSISHAIIFNNNKEKILKINQLDIDILEKVNNSFKISKMSHAQYVKFYKKKYKLDSSFRPRQLSVSDIPNNIQFLCWSFIANFLVRYKLSKKIKTLLDIFFNKKI